MTTRKGYLVALGVFVVGLGLAGFFIWRVYDRVRGMPRVEMPGEQTVELPAGDQDHFKVFKLLPAVESELGLSLSVSGQLIPEQSTAAIIVHHPQAKYYSVGESRVEQLMR